LSPELKAIVLKTSRFEETRFFFETVLGMQTKECSPIHFVIHAGEIRILFTVSDTGPEVELYLTERSATELNVLEDPNQIKIIIQGYPG
jgi:hypothetical protein